MKHFIIVVIMCIKLSMGNFISVPRSLFADSAFPPEPFTRREAFIDLVQRATREPISVPIKGGIINIERGEVVVSMRSLAARWGWSKSKVENVLKEFGLWTLIGQRTDGVITVVSINNYDVFQHPVDTNVDTNEDANWDNNKNIRNKEEKKDTIVSKEKLTPSEVAELWNSICTNLPSVQRMSEGRASKVRKRIKEFGEDDPRTFVENLFKTINSSDFLCGRVTNWKASFDWVFNNSENWVKVIEKKYNQDPQSLFPPTPQEPAAPLPPFVAETKEESLFLAANPTEEDIRKYVIDHIVIGHPKEDGETKEDYKRRMYDMFERDYKKDWIEYRVNFVTEHFYGK